jgi:hypothetical protein
MNVTGGPPIEQGYQPTDSEMDLTDVTPTKQEYQPTDYQLDVVDVALIEQEYQPTDSQLERASAIRKFNFRFVYLPTGLISLVVLIAVISLLYLSLFPPNEETQETISGIADAVTILGVIPLLILCAIVPTLAVVATVQGKRSGIAPLRQLQLLMWRLDSGIYGGRLVIERIAQKLANPFIVIQGAIAFIQTLIRRVASIFKQG